MAEEMFSKEELQNMLSLLPPGALPETEAALKEQLAGIVQEELGFAAEREERIEKTAKEALAGPKAVDLVMYVRGERKIIGKATVVEGVIFSKLDDNLSAGDEATRAITDGMLESISVAFHMRPATPDLPLKYPDMTQFIDEKDALQKMWDRTSVQQVPTQEPFVDKYPYGPK